MSTDRLALYNIAAFAVGERKIIKLTEDRESRHLLDEVWQRGQGGAIRYFLEQGQWNHAMVAARIDSSPSITPEFGYTFAFDRPADFVRLNMISADERFTDPLMDYEPEKDFYYTDVDPLYLRYVSDSDAYGRDLSKWPGTFTLWAGTWMALQIAPNMKNEIDMAALRKEEKRLRIDARSKDASEEPVRFPPLSSWARARHGRFGGNERGLRNRLIGG